MAETNDYEKAEKQSFKKYETSDLRKVLNEPNEWLAHKAGFMDGYQLGKAHAENEAHEPIKKPILQIPEPQFIPSVRLQVASMAMQGILSNAATTAAITMSLQAEALKKGLTINAEELSNLSIETAAAMSVKYADALLNELNKENNATDSH